MPPRASYEAMLATELDYLRKAGAKFGFAVEGMSLVVEHNRTETVTFSSTYIRSCVDAGDVVAATEAVETAAVGVAGFGACFAHRRPVLVLTGADSPPGKGASAPAYCPVADVVFDVAGCVFAVSCSLG